MVDDEKFKKIAQVAFDMVQQDQNVIRKEALDHNVNPSNRIRQILGLNITPQPQRSRLSVSLSKDDLDYLADLYKIDSSDQTAIKRQAAKQIAEHINKQKEQE